MSTPTLKDISAAIADPVRMLGNVRDAAGTHGVRHDAFDPVLGRTRQLLAMSEVERLDVAIRRTRLARESVDELERMLRERRDVLAAREERRVRRQTGVSRS